MTSAGLVPGDAKIKSWHDDWGMTVWGSGGKPGISSIRELNSPVDFMELYRATKTDPLCCGNTLVAGEQGIAARACGYNC